MRYCVHNSLMIGPPGSGKTMLACRIPTIQPDPVLAEALEITKVHSVAATRPIPQGIMATRPFRAPHHTVSAAALVGGGSVPRPGEISLAHHGVLFLDELPEFRRDCLEALRQPLEEGAVSVARINRSVRFPASFMLVAAMNPCPCGYATDPQRPCRCNSETIRRYLAKVSGPLLDRIDIHINLPPVLYRELSDPRDAEPSALIKERVARARRIQAARLQNEEVFSNAALNIKLTKKYCVLEETAQGLLRKALTELGLSARAYGKILKVSRTIADLEAAERIGPQHIAEAINYRGLDRCI